jgi:hypothetical protein
MDEPLAPVAAMKRIRAILDRGEVLYSVPRALDEMGSARITRVDCANVLRAGVVTRADAHGGALQYSVQTVRFEVVVEFLSESRLLVRTAWRVAP